MSRFLLVSLTVFALMPCKSHARSNADIDRSSVDVMVVGVVHLQKKEFNIGPIAGDLIRHSLEKYEPDHVVVEWLHPSIDPATTPNYRPLGDLDTLARLWGYRLSDVEARLQRTHEVLKKLTGQKMSQASTRVELAKLYFLNGDVLNAGYQCWIAQRLGAYIQDLKRLTYNNFKGYEQEVFGFSIARKQGLEYITPFDYQGEDVALNYDELLGRLRSFSIKAKRGLIESDPGWKTAEAQYDRTFLAYQMEGEASWYEEYGDLREVKELTSVLDSQKELRKIVSSHIDAGGISCMRYFQSADYLAFVRKAYYAVVRGISIDGAGQELLSRVELRNRRMLDFLERDIEKLGSKRVMVIVGAEHKLFLEDLLKVRGYNIAESLDYMPLL